MSALPDARASFAFSPENLERAKAAMANYPAGREASAVLALLDLAQRQCLGYVPQAVLDYVADLLDMPRIRVYEVASFYTMINLKPVGRHHVQVCTTTPCWLRGSEAIVKACETALGIGLGGVTGDGRFSLVEVECLGACVNAPMCQINDDFYEDLTPESASRILEALKRGETPKTGSQSGRQTSAPASGLTTLKD
jgi:NADH-quinone oxidoreductase subunit E